MQNKQAYKSDQDCNHKATNLEQSSDLDNKLIAQIAQGAQQDSSTSLGPASHSSLIDFVSEFSGEAYLRVEEHLGAGFVRLRTAEAERRQAKHDIRCVEDAVIELLRNARDAGAQNIYLASSKTDSIRRLTIIDDGSGVPKSMHELIFEPRVTSKLDSMIMDSWGVHGRGMALYSIKANVEDFSLVCSDSDKGAVFSLNVDTSKLPEKSDQSSWPSIEKTEEGGFVVGSGPHNIVRNVIEFALKNQDLRLYFGSESEILATLLKHAQENLSSQQLLFIDDLSELKAPEYLASCADAAELQEYAYSFYRIQISERTAHRILSSRIKSLHPVDKLARKDFSSMSKKANNLSDQERLALLNKDSRGLKLDPEDSSQFKRDLEKVFAQLAQKYFLELQDEPRIRISQDKIQVSFPIKKED